MPRFYRRRRPIRSRRGYRKSSGGSALALAKAAWKGVKFIRGIVNAEKRTHVVQLQTTVGTTPVINELTAIAQGDDYNGREGRSILAKSLYLRGYIQKNASATISVMRMIVVMDTMNQGTAPTWGDVFNSTDVSSPLSPTNSGGALGRFKILYDKLYRLTADTPTANLYVYRKLHHHIKYEGTASTDTVRNAIYILSLSTEATNTVGRDIFSTLKFYDN